MGNVVLQKVWIIKRSFKDMYLNVWMYYSVIDLMCLLDVDYISLQVILFVSIIQSVPVSGSQTEKFNVPKNTTRQRLLKLFFDVSVIFQKESNKQKHVHCLDFSCFKNHVGKSLLSSLSPDSTDECLIPANCGRDGHDVSKRELQHLWGPMIN